MDVLRRLRDAVRRKRPELWAAPGGFLDAEGVSPGFRGVRREGAQT